MSRLRTTSLPRNRGAAPLGTLQRCPQTVSTGGSPTHRAQYILFCAVPGIRSLPYPYCHLQSCNTIRELYLFPEAYAEQCHVLFRPRWAQRNAEQSEKPRPLPHIMSGIELQMNLELDDMAREGFKPEGYTIEEGPLKPSPFDAGDHLISSSPCMFFWYVVACCVTTCWQWF